MKELLRTAFLVSGALCASIHVQAQTGVEACGNPFKNHFGPWDYRSATPENKELVERMHFTPGIETMTKPSTTMMETMAQDVAYTLGVFPNHHRALLTMVRLSEKYKKDPPPGTKLSVECWFDRAVRFRSDDTVARAFYAQFLAKRNRKEEALAQLDLAVRQAKDNPLSHFNIGLVYFDLGAHDKALEQAHRAKDMGMQRTELVDRLKAAGKWAEPALAASAPAQ